MNIFFLDRNPMVCARYHADKHCVKMIVESAQMLSTAHRRLGSECCDILYRETHVNHPCSVWVRMNDGNYLWLYRLLEELCFEYSRRYYKVHKVQRDGLLHYLQALPKNIPGGIVFDPPQCMPDKYKDVDTVVAYRRYYCNDKAHLFRYTNAVFPDFVKGVVAQ